MKVEYKKYLNNGDVRTAIQEFPEGTTQAHYEIEIEESIQSECWAYKIVSVARKGRKLCQ
jgi:hypothetical protein